MAKAFVRENNVEFVEYREPIEKYYPKGVLSFFIDVPEELNGKVCAGWRIDESGAFTEPEFFTEIPTIGGIYIPDNKETTANYIMNMQDELAVNEAQLTTAKSTLNQLIADDVNNDTSVITDDIILDNADLLADEYTPSKSNKVGDIVYITDENGERQVYKTVEDTESTNIMLLSLDIDMPSAFVPVNRNSNNNITIGVK